MPSAWACGAYSVESYSVAGPPPLTTFLFGQLSAPPPPTEVALYPFVFQPMPVRCHDSHVHPVPPVYLLRQLNSKSILPTLLRRHRIVHHGGLAQVVGILRHVVDTGSSIIARLALMLPATAPIPPIARSSTIPSQSRPSNATAEALELP